ncbi:hypothetical protein [Motilimonas pumila]|uniref:Uncharacterized protein n=1 Tax=Motilimonas pumila TaxID=2303987 RepID=A0A418YEQ7_9GAMM|nr:hypothetical protein [Motilimonas pumila]RJG47676.1 hypothetical protein D1Z90_09690 [Motilimonas pumila]
MYELALIVSLLTPNGTLTQELEIENMQFHTVSQCQQAAEKVIAANPEKLQGALVQCELD